MTQFVNWLRLRFHCRGRVLFLVREDPTHYMVEAEIIIIMIINWFGSLKKKKTYPKGHCVSALVTVLLILAPEIV